MDTLKSGASSARKKAQNATTATTTQLQKLDLRPSSLLNQYSTFITTHASSVSSIESTLRSLTYLLPTRLSSISTSAQSADLASESLHSFIQLLSLYHDTLLSRAVAKLPGMPRLTIYNRYTKYWYEKSGIYRKAAVLLQMLTYTELLWEMAARRKGERVRWRVVVVIEALKAGCRLLMLWSSGGRMVVSPGVPERVNIPEPENENEEEDEEDELERLEGVEVERLSREKERERGGGDADSGVADLGSTSSQGVRTPPNYNDALDAAARRRVGGKGKEKEWKGERTGLVIPQLPDPNQIHSYLLSKVLTAEDVKPAPSLMHRVRGSKQLAEYLYILRPVVYAIALARARDKKSWSPWLLGVAMELAALQLRKDAKVRGSGAMGMPWGTTGREVRGKGYSRETKLEMEEWSRRVWQMGWWAMRGAFYDRVTQGVVKGTVDRLPNLVGGIVEDYKWLWDNYYFATATM